jgi:hypothetical protein
MRSLFSQLLGETAAAKSFAKKLARPNFGKPNAGTIQTGP